MTKKIVSGVGVAGFVAIVITAFVVKQPHRSMALSLAWMWFIAAVAYKLSLNSYRSTGDLAKNAIVACVVLAAIAFVRHGAPSLDEDGFTVREGFETTFADRSGAAVEVFARSVTASLVGVWLASLLRRNEHDSFDLDVVENRLVRVSAATLHRNSALLASTNPADADALLHLGEVLSVMTDAGQLVLEVKRLRGEKQ